MRAIKSRFVGYFARATACKLSLVMVATSALPEAVSAEPEKTVAPAIAEKSPDGTKEIPKIVSLKGESFERVKIISRKGEAVKFSYLEGIRTLTFSQMERSSADLLGLEEYEQEIAKETMNKRQKADKKILADAEESKIKARDIKLLRDKQRKQLEDWARLVQLEGSRATTEECKLLFNKPPFTIYEDGAYWNDVCWNPLTEQMESIRVRHTNTNLRGIYSSKTTFESAGKVFTVWYNSFDINNLTSKGFKLPD